ncbi:5'-nucleotidase-like [Amphiura filiformis]|uniref:5'-nucleotidase-like n=1 Tax=Amphiura filiformis TaxID=82378 RepID=UPI003B2149C8
MQTPFIFLIVGLIVACNARQDFNLTILHTFGVISSFEQFDSSGDECSPEENQNGECFGGVARRGTAINGVRNEGDDINVCLLDSGNPFTGGLPTWFDHYKGRATSYFMNQLGYDAMTLGNQEFLLGPAFLGIFLDEATFDVLSANFNSTTAPALQRRIGKSAVKMFGDERVGVIGYGSQAFNGMGNIANVLDDPIEAIQTEVDALTSMGVNKIIVLGQSSGSGVEETEVAEIARTISGVDIIVIGGLDIYQYDDDCTSCSPPVDVPENFNLEPYPIVITPNDDPNGKVLIVHGYHTAKYLGRLDVTFDEEGKVEDFNGGPILLDKDVEQDPPLLEEIMEWAEPISNPNDPVIVGRADVFLEGGGTPRNNPIIPCRQQECNLGNLLADAMIWKCLESLTEEEALNASIIAFMNGGGIRDNINEGDIYYESDIKAVLPFSNTFDSVELEGRYVREMLEQAVSAGVGSFQDGFFK